ncbi:trehalase-like [Chrysoperla carnea]|uniref:trehalase-like n=1 Tax=Chrysoperla carnea TaxID=189513 RepID=UPI001D08DF47|nr:trehalase-like [Chrysoperla carnea]
MANFHSVFRTTLLLLTTKLNNVQFHSYRLYGTYKNWSQKFHAVLNSPQYNVYCIGELLHVIQMKHLYPDSKRFVDKKLRVPPQQVLNNFALLKRIKPHLPESSLSKFLLKNFEDEHSLQQYTPTDWAPYPELLTKIKDRKLRKFALELHALWNVLSRRIYEDCMINADKYSLLYVPKPFVIPGGRFREYYYWDSYWIIRGLLICDMYESAKHMIENYLYLVEKYGLIPNGGRLYYVDRSQPPLLAKMFDTYMDFTNDEPFLNEALPKIEEEFNFWDNTRSVSVQKDSKIHMMYHYDSFQFTPRPESYREDFRCSLALPKDARPLFYNEVRAAAESGIDFSSRWWVPDWELRPDFTNIRATHIIPVDLNSILENNARILAKSFERIGNDKKAKLYKAKADQIKTAIDQVLWNDDVGIWCDYDYINQVSRTRFYPSNLTPLWTQSYPFENQKYIEKAVKYLKNKDIINIYVGGVPSSLKRTGEQWDLPNAWAPHQDIVIKGLSYSNNDEAQKLAQLLAERWVRHNYILYKESRSMFEKYSAMAPGMGEGGEYEIQTGFGWTNGVIIDLITSFNIRLDVEQYI